MSLCRASASCHELYFDPICLDIFNACVKPHRAARRVPRASAARRPRSSPRPLFISCRAPCAAPRNAPEPPSSISPHYASRVARRALPPHGAPIPHPSPIYFASRDVRCTSHRPLAHDAPCATRPAPHPCRGRRGTWPHGPPHPIPAAHEQRAPSAARRPRATPHPPLITLHALRTPCRKYERTAPIPIPPLFRFALPAHRPHLFHPLIWQQAALDFRRARAPPALHIPEPAPVSYVQRSSHFRLARENYDFVGAAARTQCVCLDCPCWSFIAFILFSAHFIDWKKYVENYASKKTLYPTSKAQRKYLAGNL